MIEEERAALAALRRFSPALTGDDVWSSLAFHVEGLHPDAERLVQDGIQDAKASIESSPLGIVIQGQKGVGKTHLLGWTRRQVLQEGGYFFLASLVPGVDFWVSTAEAVTEELNREREDGHRQLAVFLSRLAAKVGVSERLAQAVAGETSLSLPELDGFVEAVIRLNRQVGMACQETLRALVLYASPALRQIEAARGYLKSWPEIEADERAKWRIRALVRPAQLIVRDVTWLLALTGPIVIAVDQIDALVENSTKKTDEAADFSADSPNTVFAGLGDGLMQLRESTRGTMSIVSCLPHSWAVISAAAADTVPDRFRDVRTLDQIHAPVLARQLVEKRFRISYQQIGFTPPYPLWPVQASAFNELTDTTPRGLLQLIDRHIRRCLRDNKVRELTRFDIDEDGQWIDIPPARSSVDLAAFDARFAEVRREADVRPALDHTTEDEVMRTLLSAGLDAWIKERGGDGDLWLQHKPPRLKSGLHARLVRTVDDEVEEEHHWAFRAIGHQNPRAALSRIQHARGAADLHQGALGRELIVLRNIDWSNGSRTQEEVTAFRDAGGRDVPITDADLRTFSALRELLADDSPGLDEWLVNRKPATKSELFTTVLPPVDSGSVPKPSWRTDDPDRNPTPVTAHSDRSVVTLGESINDRTMVGVDLESLRKHTAIFAGSGSGKTVLIRRLVEECALLGVSVIVLDSNNDLARLGDHWPEPPPGWLPGDAARADEYHANVETLVWTPGHSARPLAFPALPDFAGVGDDQDDFRMAVDAAVDALAPRAKLGGTTAKAERSKAVLREVISAYGREGKRSLPGLIAMLSDLPDGVSSMSNAERFAADMAETLRAAQVNDPLLRDDREAVDPGVLLTPSPGSRSRISVISLVGLGSEEQKQGFVSQLQMELFAWIRKHPAGDRPLGGLLVTDEAQNFASTSDASASTRSTIALASQARKFGLGLIFATQAPKSLHNKVSGNATTMIIGRLGALAQINAAQDMARARGSSVPEIAKLTPGQFYVGNDEFGFRQTRTPLCLSHHPNSALTPEEVIKRARGDWS